jgi:hypothetical protein
MIQRMARNTAAPPGPRHERASAMPHVDNRPPNPPRRYLRPPA